MVSLEFRYKLTREEIEEALLDLDWKREGTFSRINLWVISIIGVIILIGFMRSPDQVFLFLLLLIIIVMLLYMTYGIRYIRKRKAKKMAGQQGEYRLKITDTSIIPGDGKENIKLAGRRLLFLSSEHVCVMRVDRDVFTIPKSAITETQQKELKNIAAKHKCSFINIVLRKERVLWRRQMR